jgi:beta-lactam-binding protein with PASTA domain
MYRVESTQAEEAHLHGINKDICVQERRAKTSSRMAAGLVVDFSPEENKQCVCGEEEQARQVIEEQLQHGAVHALQTVQP